MSTITIGVDLAKSVFSVCAMDGAGHVLKRQDLKREPFALWLAQQPAGTVVAMEACSGAHHWARRCLEHGLQPRLMAAQFVAPFRKSRTIKNDRKRPPTSPSLHAGVWSFSFPTWDRERGDGEARQRCGLVA